MSHHAPTRMLAVVVALAMVFGSISTAWAVPAKPLRPNTTPAQSHVVGQTVAAPSREGAPLPPAQLAGSSAERMAFTADERIALQQRQAQAQHLKQFQGGEVIVIGTTALVIILAVVLIVVLVD